MMELRKHPRIPVEMDAVVMLQGQSLPARAVQIGGGGMCLQLAAPVPVSHPVEVLFTLPEGPEVRIAGVIWWKKSGEVGIRFEYTGAARIAVENWVKQRLSNARFFAKPI